MQCVKCKSNLKTNLPKRKVLVTFNLTRSILTEQHWGELLAKENPMVGFLMFY